MAQAAFYAQMHYTECQSQSGGSRRKRVDSFNPVSVEQHLIRSALYRAAAAASAGHDVKVGSSQEH